MIILMYGHRGWIGQQCIELLQKTNHTLILGKARCDDFAEMENEIKETQPTHIFSFIGRTHGTYQEKEYSTIDYLEQKGKLVDNIRDNLYSPLVLALLAQKYDIHFLYLGTGCIFTYDEQHPFEQEINGFKEKDVPNFYGSSYSIVKGFTDRIMELLKENTLNLRIRMPITEKNHPRNFITKIVRYSKICSIKNSMSVLPDLLPIAIDMAEKKITGTFNFTNPGLISHNEILEMYREIVDNDFTWENFNQEEQSKVLDAVRSNNYLDTTKLELLYNIPSIKESVRNILLHWKK